MSMVLTSVLGDTADGILGFVMIIVVGLVGFVLYFLPSIIAIKRKHRQVGPIIIINLFFGWSLIGWVVALAWSAAGGAEDGPAISPSTNG